MSSIKAGTKVYVTSTNRSTGRTEREPAVVMAKTRGMGPVSEGYVPVRLEDGTMVMVLAANVLPRL